MEVFDSYKALVEFEQTLPVGTAIVPIGSPLLFDKDGDHIEFECVFPDGKAIRCRYSGPLGEARHQEMASW